MNGEYRRRLLDDDLDELMGALPAVAIEGPKGVGKTRTAAQRARTTRQLDDPATLAIAEADPGRLLQGDRPILLDEWQRAPALWDLVRRAVDDGAPAGSFLLTGSATPDTRPTHSGAGRIVTLRMRPMSVSERIVGQTVSLGGLLTGARKEVAGSTPFGLKDYVDEIVASGLPGVRALTGRARRLQLTGYLDRIIDREIADETGIAVRSPAVLRRWLTAYAAATGSTASIEKIRDAATPGQDHKPARDTVAAYRDALGRLWMLDEIDAWIPAGNPLNELGRSPKRALADPALAAAALGLDDAALLSGAGTGGALLGALFEHLAALSLKAYAARNDARVGHLRTARGRQEIDLIVERGDGSVVALEVKLKQAVDDHDVRHLRWLGKRLGDRLLDAVVVTTGPAAYRRPDGIAVVPLALLGA